MDEVLFRLLITIILVIFLTDESQQLPIPSLPRIGEASDNKYGTIVDFLVKFGYVPKDDVNSGALRSESYLRDAIRSMQKFAGLPVTGYLDQSTYNLTQRKRCGVPDFFPSEPQSRVRRFALKGPKWDKLKLTWKVNMGPSSIDKSTLLDELRRALNIWSQHSKLSFYETSDKNADIIISFLKGDHGDNLTFDGPGGVLAHAFFPAPDIGGDAHFDADEKWIKSGLKDPEGVGLFGVAAHEFGHSLGLSHSSVVDSLMFPYYRDIGYDFSLPQDDINGIQQLYGSRYERKWATISPYRPDPNNRPTSRPTQPSRSDANRPVTTKITDIPETCDTDFDAISSIRNEIFIFKGRYFWRLNEDKTLERTYAIPIHNFWFKMPKDLEKIDAVYERPSDNKITFFIGNQYWLFEGNYPEPGYPKPLTSLGLPKELKSIDAVTVWGYNGVVYFFAGDQYWRFDERKNRVDLDYPRKMTIWKGVPINLDAAFLWHATGKTYFFKGKKFWQFNDRTMSVTPDSPQSSVHFWFDPFCRNASYPDLNESSSTEKSVLINDSSSSSLLSSSLLINFLSMFISILFIYTNQFVNTR